MKKEFQFYYCSLVVIANAVQHHPPPSSLLKGGGKRERAREKLGLGKIKLAVLAFSKSEIIIRIRVFYVRFKPRRL